MRKKALLGIVLALTAVSTTSQAQELILNCDKKGQVRSVSPRYAGHAVLQEGKGRTGNAIRIICPAYPEGQKRSGDVGRFHADGKTIMKIVSVTRPVHTGVYLKGKGKGRFGLLVFDKDRKVIYPPGLMKPFEVDSPEQWVLVDFDFKPEANSMYARKAAFILPYIQLEPDSDILMDDWETRFAEQSGNIVIEE